MLCSIVILNWNGAQHLRRFLPGVVQFCPSNCEVVVADNGSTDESLSLLRSDFPMVRLIVLDRNYGFAEGYNRALEQVDAEYTLLLNSDVEVQDDFLSPMLAYMRDHNDVGALQPKILAQYDLEHIGSPEGVLFEHAGAAGGYIDRLGYPYCRGRVMGQLERDHGQYDSTVECFWASGACFLTRTALYKELGGLDSAFFAHMEEIDLCWRMHRVGKKVVCLPQTSVYHLGGGALPYESPRKVFLNFRNCLLMLRKNLPFMERVWLMPARCLLDYVASLQYLLKGDKEAAMAVVKARVAYHRMKHDVLREAARFSMPSPAVLASMRRPFSIILQHFCK